MPRDVLPPDDYVKIAHAAADLIEKNGHVKGKLYSSDGEMCIRGAVASVRGEFADQFERELFRRLGFGTIETVPEVAAAYWNNYPTTTKEMVVQKLRSL